MENERVIEFLRKKDLIFRRELGRGACGQTILLYDPTIDEEFVCKKYAPMEDEWREVLFKNFVREIKLLHLLNHRNVVRVFNHYLYPEKFVGYILMEHVKGKDIQSYIKEHPENLNETFTQAVEGFAHLEESKILHRDIRPLNLLVTDSGLLKIIDFGFGKQTASKGDFDKSVTLNWWCQPPKEFADQRYDFGTEVYFVGKLFEKFLVDNKIETFKYEELLRRMCAFEPDRRIESFGEIRRQLLAGHIQEADFSEEDLLTYRWFAESLSSVFSKIERGAKYIDDVDEVQAKLTHLHKNVMLEKDLPNNAAIVHCFLNGASYYRKEAKFPVGALRELLALLRTCSREKKLIVLSNMQSRLDAVERYEKKSKFDDDIPF